MKLPPEVEAVIARLVDECGFTDPRTAGTPSVELVWRSLKLQRDIFEHTAQRQRAIAGAQAIAAALPGLRRKAVDADDALEVELVRLELTAAVEAEAEQTRLDPKGNRRKPSGKAMAGMDRATERRFCSFLEALGGGPADGRGTLGAEALLCDERTFNRGVELWHGEAEPETDAERVALKRWRGASP